ncbi:MAG: hypothetical protein WCG10_07800, partial [Chlamydiota bacterium]
MDSNQFLKACEFVKTNLIHLDINRAYNSIGSNIFLKFGEGKEYFLRNGIKSVEYPWCIWVSDASWRLSQYGNYIVGSDDLPDDMESSLQKLLCQRFQSFQFLSQFLDVEFNFTDGYQLTTFFNWAEEDQWVILLPDKSSINIDCSSVEALKQVQEIAKHLPIIEPYKKMEFPEDDLLVTDIT